MRHAASIALIIGVLSSASVTAAMQEARLLRRPTVSRTEVAFSYASDLWIVGRKGGKARRLTATSSEETDPRFSPDGTQIAFTATVGGNTDVYVMPSVGGSPRRLTYHPGLDMVRGWTRDGKRVIFASARDALPTPRASSYTRLWTVPLEGGPPRMLPIPRAHIGAFSPDEKWMAYEEVATEFESKEAQWQSAQWRHYRGGRTHPIRVMNLTDHSVEKLPWRDSNDSDPMWIGDDIYFVSDRDFTANLYAYRGGNRKLEQLTHHDDFDVMNASAGPDAIAYEQAGYIHLLDPRTGHSQRLRIEVEGDFPWAAEQTKNVSDMIGDAAVSPNGAQIAFEARGEIFLTVQGGGAVNFTETPATHDRAPAWSADGRQLAWLSDASGEYQLFVADPKDRKQPRAIDLPLKGYFATPIWSPDGRHLLLRDDHLTLWMIELANGRATRIDADTFDDPQRHIEPVWSVDSRWVAYSKSLPNHLRAIFLYSLDGRRAYQITDSRVDAISSAFDRGGDYLYFLVSTDYGQNVEWTGMITLDRPVTRTVNAAVLSAHGVSPLTPDKASERAPGGIDVEGLSKRIVPLDIPARDYIGLVAGPAGTVFYGEHDTSGVKRLLSPPSMSLYRYRVRDRKAETIVRGADSREISVDGAKLLYRRGGDRKWLLADAERPADAADVELETSGLSMRVEPRAEWANIFREAWRIQRDYFYQPSMHGANWQAVYDKYFPWVEHVNHRADLGYLLAMVGGELSVGHSANQGVGDLPHEERVTVGMLGADFSVDRGRYRIERIYTGDRWSPSAQAPLAAPGVSVKEGEYLLEVNGRPVLPRAEVYAAFEGTANKATQLRIGPTTKVADSRLVTVIPLASEEGLRTHEDWIEKNRERVAELSGGRIGYVWIENTGPQGYESFNRQFYAQLDKEGMVVDIRYNQGGYIADYIVNALTKTRTDYLVTRAGADSPLPITAIRGPKVMVANESAGSGGDALAYHFKQANVGPLIGTRTWGGLVGPTAEPPPQTIDGGGMSAPSASFYDLQGRWLVENEGVAPDIEVENTPAAMIAGRDPQLERAVDEALRQLKGNPVKYAPRPAPPDRASRPPDLDACPNVSDDKSAAACPSTL